MRVPHIDRGVGLHVRQYRGEHAVRRTLAGTPHTQTTIRLTYNPEKPPVNLRFVVRRPRTAPTQKASGMDDGEMS